MGTENISYSLITMECFEKRKVAEPISIWFNSIWHSVNEKRREIWKTTALITDNCCLFFGKTIENTRS